MVNFRVADLTSSIFIPAFESPLVGSHSVVSEARDHAVKP
ncbi:hypothetical protein BH10ACI1_BH10ACI1_35510 [soil metagenome]